MALAKTYVRRAFVTAWIVLALAGALNHTIAMKTAGRRYDLGLPHLKYGYVMFNRHLPAVRVYEFARAGESRRNVAELVPTTSLGYTRARLAIAMMFQPRYLKEICFRSLRSMDDEISFFVDEYRVNVDPDHPARSAELRCNVHGLEPR